VKIKLNRGFFIILFMKFNKHIYFRRVKVSTINCNNIIIIIFEIFRCSTINKYYSMKILIYGYQNCTYFISHIDKLSLTTINYIYLILEKYSSMTSRINLLI